MLPCFFCHSCAAFISSTAARKSEQTFSRTCPGGLKQCKICGHAYGIVSWLESLSAQELNGKCCNVMSDGAPTIRYMLVGNVIS